MNHSIDVVLFIRSIIQISHCDSHYWSTQLSSLSLSTSMIQSYVTFEAKLQSTPTSKPYLCIAHPFSVMNYRNRIRFQITTKHIFIHFDSFHSVLIIIITDSIYIEYTSLNGLESKVQNVLILSFCPSCINPSPWHAIFAHSTHIHSIDRDL